MQILSNPQDLCHVHLIPIKGTKMDDYTTHRDKALEFASEWWNTPPNTTKWDHPCVEYVTTQLAMHFKISYNHAKSVVYTICGHLDTNQPV